MLTEQRIRDWMHAIETGPPLGALNTNSDVCCALGRIALSEGASDEDRASTTTTLNFLTGGYGAPGFHATFHLCQRLYQVNDNEDTPEARKVAVLEFLKAQLPCT